MTGLYDDGASGHSIGVSGRWVMARPRTSRASTGVSGPVFCGSGRHLRAGVGESDRWDRTVENQRKEHVA